VIVVARGIAYFSTAIVTTVYAVLTGMRAILFAPPSPLSIRLVIVKTRMAFGK
jgi:hypothetical protein